MDRSGRPTAFDAQCGRWFGVAAGGKFADIATTAIGVRHPELAELNPVIRSLFNSYGVSTAVVLVGCAALVFLLVVTELGVARCLREDASKRTVTLLRAIGYLVPAGLWLSVAGYNAYLIYTIG